MAKSTDKDIIRAKEQYKQLAPKQKLDFIFEYYKLHILVGVALVIGISYTVYVTFISPPLKAGLTLAVVDQFLDMEKTDQFIAKYNDLVIENKDKFEFCIEDYLFEQSDFQYLMALQQKFVVQITAQELDVIITDVANFHTLLEQGIFRPVQELFSAADLAEVEIVSGSEEGSEVFLDYGIILDKKRCQDAYDILLDDRTLVIGFLSNTQRLETALVFAEKLCIFPAAD